MIIRNTILRRIILPTAIVLAGSFAITAGAEEDRPLQIVTTIFPEYDWMREILGDNPADIGLEFLLDSGVDAHSFQPGVGDIVTVSSCDLLIYVGGESDSWIEDALAESVNPDMRTICLLEILGDSAFEEEETEGMQETRGEDEEEEPESDEHVWLSLTNAELFCRAFADALCGMDPANADTYLSNLENYVQKLQALDGQYRKTVEEGERNVLLFADRFPFRYLTEEYGLDYYAAFSGCSAEAEASFETLTFLIEKTRELQLPAIEVIEGSDRQLAETIAANAGEAEPQILTMNSLQSVTAGDTEEGMTYLSAMEQNLEVLKTALN